MELPASSNGLLLAEQNTLILTSTPLRSVDFPMPIVRILSAVEQVAASLRAELLRGQWSEMLPGVDRLAPELGVSRKTLEAALRQLEGEGLLLRHGQRRRRSIHLADNQRRPGMRVALLLYEPADRQLDYIVELQHALVAAGHTVIFAARSLAEMKLNVERVRQVVAQTSADAWVILAGSREIVSWFSEQSFSAFALFGRQEGLRIAATRPDKVPAMAAATRHLIGLGHTRVVLVTRKMRRLPELGRSELAFLNELKANGIQTSPFNLPDWEETREGIHDLLISLFRITPPTALIIDEAPIFAAVLQYFVANAIRVPQQVSLICTDDHPNFAWCTPSISHIRWNSSPLVRRVLRWAANVSQGRKDVRQTRTRAEFIIGGTTGPAPGAG